MSRLGSEPLGAALLVQGELRPEDEATRTRLAELFLAVDRLPPRSPQVKTPLPTPTIEPAPTPNERLLSRARPTVKISAALAGLISLFTQLWRFRLGIRSWRRPDDPVPSELSPPVIQVPGGRTGHTLDPPGPAVEPAVAPLLLPRWTRGILTAALSTDRPGGSVDVERLADYLARLEFPARLPRRRRSSLSGGADVLIDLSEDMIPFRADLQALIQALGLVVGKDQLIVQRFAGQPLTRIGPGRRATWQAYRPPVIPRCVLIVSNLRLADADFRDDNATYHREPSAVIDLALNAGCRVVVLVPNTAARVPSALRAKVGVIEWDRTTSAATTARAVRR